VTPLDRVMPGTERTAGRRIRRPAVVVGRVTTAVRDEVRRLTEGSRTHAAHVRFLAYTAATKQLYIYSDEKLLYKILTCPNHILRTLLPPSTAQNYSFRNRPHNRQLPDRISRITDCNFTVRMLYRNMY